MDCVANDPTFAKLTSLDRAGLLELAPELEYIEPSECLSTILGELTNLNTSGNGDPIPRILAALVTIYG